MADDYGDRVPINRGNHSSSANPSSSSSSSASRPHFISDLQILGDKPTPSQRTITREESSSGGADLGPRVTQKWSILGPVQYVNVPSAAPIYEGEEAEEVVAEAEPRGYKRWLRLGVWVVMLLSLALLFSGIYLVVNSHSLVLLIVFAIIFVICLVIYLRTQLLSPNLEYLRNVCDQESTPEYLELLRSTKPVIKMSIRCFHYTGMGLDQNRDPESAHVVVTEGELKKIQTHHATKEFVFDTWEDQSSALGGLEQFGMIKLKLKTRIGFADEFTKQKFEEEQARFIDEHKGKDTQYEYKAFFEVPNLRPKSLSISQTASRPALLSVEWYMTCTFFLVGWPYNEWLDVKSTKVSYIVQKVVKREPTQEDNLRRLASERVLARKATSASVKRVTSSALTRKPTENTVERRTTSSIQPQGEFLSLPPSTPPHPSATATQAAAATTPPAAAGAAATPAGAEAEDFPENPFLMSSPRGNFV